MTEGTESVEETETAETETKDSEEETKSTEKDSEDDRQSPRTKMSHPIICNTFRSHHIVE
mgnify:CR=1 FL=1